MYGHQEQGKIIMRRRLLILVSFVSVCLALITSCEKYDHKSVPLILLGIDGAAWKFMDPLLEKGELPTFKKLIDSGVRGDLQTLLPTQSVIIWNTIVTGCLPEKHGITGWLSGAGDQLAITSTMRRKAALWDILSLNKKKGLYLNWWSTWPVYPIEGIMVSNHIFYKDTPDPVYPREMLPVLKEYMSVPKQNERSVPQLDGQKKVTQTEIYQKDNRVFSLTENLLKHGPYDLIAVYVRGLDMVEHEFYRDSFPEEFQQPGKREAYFKDYINDYYIALDAHLARLLAHFKKRVDIVIVSDHGMEAMPENPSPITRLLVNNLLQDLGYLKIKDQYDLDWSRTKVFQYDYHIPGLVRKLRVNLQGRDPSGIVPPQEKESLLDDITNLLASLKVVHKEDHQFLKPLFSKVERVDNEVEIILQLNLEVLPEEILKLPDREQKVDNYLTHFLVHSSGQHDAAPPGIVIMSGPSFARATKIKNCHVTDILPTILFVLGLPVSEEMDGRVQGDALDTIKQQQSVVTVPTYPLPDSFKSVSPDQMVVPEGVESTIRRDLRSLGYIQ